MLVYACRSRLGIWYKGTMMDTIRLTTAQAIVKWLKNQRTVIDGEEVPMFAGVFGIFGHGNVTCLGHALESEQDDLPTWRGHNEQGMALSAVAYAKAKRRRQIMVAASSIGPGSTNMVTAAGVAHANRLPVLLFSGDTFQHRKVDPVLQQIEQFHNPTETAADTFKPVTRYWDRITKPEQIIRSLPQALAVMLDPADCGPAFFALPQDVQSEAYNYPVDFFEPRMHYIRRPGPDPREVATAADALRTASKPLIISGGGVHYSGAVEELTAFAERRAIPVVETVAGKATLVSAHPNHAGAIGVSGDTAANLVAEDADVVIAIGTRLQDFTTGSWALFKNPNVRFVSLNAARWDAVKQHATSVIGDAMVSLEQLDAALGDYTAPDEWLSFAQAKIGEWNAHLDSFKRPADVDEDGNPKPPAYNQIIQVINEICDDSDYQVSAASGLPGELLAGWRTKQVGSFDAEFGFSCMGYEISGGLGAKMALPDRDVIAWVGDGSYLMMNSDIYASVLTDHKVIYMVLDNGGFAVINRLQTNMGGVEFNNLLRTTRHTNFQHVDFVKHAESLGAYAELVQSHADLPPAYARAMAADRTYVIVMKVSEYEWVGGGTWWDVGVPEVSDRDDVLAARGEWEAESKHQRDGV
jgi:3D-(3,5/4)-trihydroxycyclohexane-1,2-dione acylhydrolase (decyclizing)